MRGQRTNPLARFRGPSVPFKTTILIRWTLEHDVVVIPKSVRPERIQANADVFDFSISPEDMALLDDLNEDLRITWDPTDAP